MRCHLMISGRSCKGLMKKIRLQDKDKLATMLAQTSAARFHPTLKKIIPQWHWAVLVLCFQHMQMLSELNCIQKSFFHDSFPPNFGVLQLQFYWKFHWKHALLFHLFLLHKPEAFFHANRCHEPIFAHSFWRTINYMEFCSCLFVYITNLYLSIRQKKFHETPWSSAAIFSKKNTALCKFNSRAKCFLKLFLKKCQVL